MQTDASANNGTLLVPVANQETADRQLETAIDIASERCARIVVCYVQRVPPSLSLEDGRDYLLGDEPFALLETAVEHVEAAGVPATRTIRIARSVPSGICGAIDSYDADLALLGWRGRPPRSGIVLGSHLDVVLRSATCDVLVQRIQTPRPPVETILVAIAGGPHDVFAADAAAAISRAQNASVTLLHVRSRTDADCTREAASVALAKAAESFADDVSTEQRIIRSDDVAAEITDRTASHDLTLLGTSRGGFFRRRFLGTVSEAVGRHAEGVVILAQRYEPPTSRFGYLRPW